MRRRRWDPAPGRNPGLSPPVGPVGGSVHRVWPLLTSAEGLCSPGGGSLRDGKTVWHNGFGVRHILVQNPDLLGLAV